MSTLDRINKCLAELGHQPVTDENIDFRANLGLDSLGWLEFIVLIEDEFEFEIPELEYDNGQLNTVKQAVEYLERRSSPDGN